MTATEPCFTSLRDAILSGELPPGTRLPPERRLAEEYGVNRVSVRSALGRLAASRLVTVRQGSGYVVRDYREVAGPELLPGLASLARRGGSTAPLAADLLLVRRSLARAVLERLAASPPGPGARAPVALSVDAFAAAVARGAGPDELAARDLDVLRALLSATGSAVLALCLNPVAEALDGLPALRAAIYADPPSNVRGWQALLAWLAAPTSDTLDSIVALLAARDDATVRTLADA